MEKQRTTTDARLPRGERIDILLEEYRSLNALLLFRLAVMDRRLPVSLGFLTAAVASVLALPEPSRTAALIATPSVLLWLGRTTVQHARAKEDNLRRISEIEQQINAIACEKLLLFQSRHPTKAKIVSGRTGMAVVVATSVSALLMLLFCLLLFLNETSPFPRPLYVAYVVAVAVDLISGPLTLTLYRYERPTEVVLPE